MDSELEIQNRLKQNIPRDSDELVKAETHLNNEPQNTGFVSDMGDTIDMYKLYDYFVVPPQYRHGDAEQKIQAIYRWAANIAQSTDYLSVANVISAHMDGQGAGQIGVSDLDRTYQYVQLQKQIDHLKREQGLLNG